MRISRVCFRKESMRLSGRTATKFRRIFQMMAREGKVEEQMMYNTYNMGIGMIVAVDPADVDKTIAAMKAAGDTPYIVGEIKDGEKGVTLC